MRYIAILAEDSFSADNLRVWERDQVAPAMQSRSDTYESMVILHVLWHDNVVKVYKESTCR